MLTTNEIRRLADVLSGAQRRRLSTLSSRACGNWASLDRLAAGKAIRSDTHERLATWFAKNWPAEIPWPLSTPRPNGKSSNR
jgi:hypothetical protein